MTAEPNEHIVSSMTAMILSIGDELALGQTVDTNSAWLSQQLAAVGVDILCHVTVPDDQRAIENSLRSLALRCNVLLVSGGIGPTEDDLTRQALAAVMNQPLEENAVWLAELQKFFEARGRKMPPINRIQAMIPRGAEMIFNTAGTAAGIRAVLRGLATTVAPASARGIQVDFPADFDPLCHVFVMPGVPKEMKAMFNRDVLPFLRQQAGGAVILSRTLHTFGLGESAVAEKLGDLMRRDRNPSVGTTVSGGVVSLRINARFPSLQMAQAEVSATSAECAVKLGDLIYGQDEDTLPLVVSRLLAHVPNGTVATTESCTGGLLAKMLTDIPGSSSYFHYGWVTYANQAKQTELHVPATVLAENGAVSEPVVQAMAAGARQRGNATYALAISGIAGPEGGTPEKPVGLVWIALAHPTGSYARKFIFPGDREMIRDRAAKTALTMLRYQLLEKPLPF